MEARKLISGASYGPETLQLIMQAFDLAWSEIAHHFGDDNQVVEAARQRLAHAVLAVVNEDSQDIELLKKTALQVMALSSGR
jgi:ribosome biogenesis SPOUT family RNA methylase Rps3